MVSSFSVESAVYDHISLFENLKDSSFCVRKSLFFSKKLYNVTIFLVNSCGLGFTRVHTPNFVLDRPHPLFHKTYFTNLSKM